MAEEEALKAEVALLTECPDREGLELVPPDHVQQRLAAAAHAPYAKELPQAAVVVLLDISIAVKHEDVCVEGVPGEHHDLADGAGELQPIRLGSCVLPRGRSHLGGDNKSHTLSAATAHMPVELPRPWKDLATTFTL